LPIKENKVGTAPNQFSSDLFLLSVVLQRISLKMLDPLCSSEDWDLDARGGFA
jgi:hypothetical protein